MSSPDRRLVALGLVLPLVALSACQVRPLYATAPAATESAAVEGLRSIAVEPLRDRVGQTLMNELIFLMRGGAKLSETRYVLRLIVSSRSSSLGIEEFEAVPTATLIALTATYTLTESSTGRVVTTGSVSSTASYDFSSQRFANLRAERDAEDRAARTAAADIRTRLAAVLAGGG